MRKLVLQEFISLGARSGMVFLLATLGVLALTRATPAQSPVRPIPKDSAVVDSIDAIDQRGQPAYTIHPADGKPSIPWLFAFAEEAIR